MAVIQISKIQVRRGLQENLPQLASGEMGWSVDERRLWIGNGTLSEGAPLIGNTEILTEGSDILSLLVYTYKGSDSGYTSQTGPTATTPVVRTVQNKLDEIVSLRDFITAADISSNDYTASLQRAIDQVFPINYYAEVRTRRVLHIPAGTYPVASVITVPPHAHICGDGAQSSIIKQTSVIAEGTFKLRDSKGQVDTTMGAFAADLPFQVTIEDLQLENATDNDIAIVDSAKDIFFNRVKFKGSKPQPVLLDNSKAAVRIKDTVGPTRNVIFDKCIFSEITDAWAAQGDVAGVILNHCHFDTLYRGLVTSANVASPQGVKVVSSFFSNISKQAIVSGDNSSITSAFNYYDQVGYGNGSYIVTTSANTAVVTWNTSNNYSIGDIYTRSAGNITIKPLIEILSNAQPVVAQLTTSGTLQQGIGRIETLLDNSVSATTSLTLPTLSTTIVDYSITRSGNTRIGTMKVTQIGGTATYEDNYSETANVGVILSFQPSASDAILSYDTTNTGSNATLKYSVRSFI